MGAGTNRQCQAVHPHYKLVLAHDRVDCSAGGGWGHEGGEEINNTSLLFQSRHFLSTNGQWGMKDGS